MCKVMELSNVYRNEVNPADILDGCVQYGMISFILLDGKRSGYSIFNLFKITPFGT